MANGGPRVGKAGSEGAAEMRWAAAAAEVDQQVVGDKWLYDMILI